MGLKALLLEHSPGIPTVVTVGVFDGVHLGHVNLLERVIDVAASSPVKSASAALMFRRQPRSVLRPQEEFRYLCSVEHRIRLIREAGIHTVVPIDFDESIRSITAREFLAMSQDHLGMTDFVIGPRTAIGRDRAGDPETLGRLGTELGFGLHNVAPTHAGNTEISSTAIRRALNDGDLDGPASMLGRRFAIAGTVIMGDQRGRTLGFPTANINPESGDYSHVVPSNGIYAAWVTLADGSQHEAAVSIGVRPTFGEGVRLVEAFLLDFDGDLYGQRLIIEFISRLRAELKFDSAESLIVQMHKDVDDTRDILSRVAAAPAS